MMSSVHFVRLRKRMAHVLEKALSVSEADLGKNRPSCSCQKRNYYRTAKIGRLSEPQALVWWRCHWLPLVLEEERRTGLPCHLRSTHFWRRCTLRKHFRMSCLLAEGVAVYDVFLFPKIKNFLFIFLHSCKSIYCFFGLYKYFLLKVASKKEINDNFYCVQSQSD